MRNVSDKSCRESKGTHFVFNKLSPKIVPFMKCEKIRAQPVRPQTTIQDGACALNAGYVMLKTRGLRNMFFHGNNGHANAPQCYIIRKLPGFFPKSALARFVEFSE
jgi:hypothetical protein